MIEQQLKALAPYYPVSGTVTIYGLPHEWMFKNRSLGILHYSINGEPLRLVNIKDTDIEFQRHLNNVALETAKNGEPVSAVVAEKLREVLGHKIEDVQLMAYAKAWQYLNAEGNAFLTYCCRLIFDYHALDRALTQTTLLSTTRARYSSPSSALLHVDCTGSSGAGKNDLVNRITALILRAHLELFSTVSPTALQYRTLEKVRDKQGRIIELRADKDYFNGKVICITEVADAAGHSALKALAETDELAEYTHLATQGAEAIDMTITGPRCVIITSVEGVNDEQVKRRFIHGSVSEDSFENKEKKLALVETLMRERKDIRDDPRLPVACAGIDIIFSTQDVVFEPIEDDTWALIQELNALFLVAGYGLTNIKQFFSLCECIALWKRFNRHYTRVEIEDVLEAWFLLATFERETITKTSRQGIETLKAIKESCVAYEALYESNPQVEHTVKRPTRREVVKECKVSQAHVYRLLQSRPNEQGKCGELIELGYVRDCEGESGQICVELTELGETVLGEVPRHAIINIEEYEPKEPIFPDDIDIEARLTPLDGLCVSASEA